MDIVQREIEFPGGKRIMLTHSKPYVTDNPVEIDFCSQLKGVSILDLTDKEFRAYITTQYTPSVENPTVTPETAAEFLFVDAMEEPVIEWLRAKGWTVYKKQKKADTSTNDDGNGGK